MNGQPIMFADARPGNDPARPIELLAARGTDHTVAAIPTNRALAIAAKLLDLALREIADD